MDRITEILSTMDQGDPTAAGELLPLVHDLLCELAAAELAVACPDQTLQAGSLVAQAYSRLVADTRPQTPNARAHFFAAAAETMRRVLVERAKRLQAVGQSGEPSPLPLDRIDPPVADPSDQLLAVDGALEHLQEQDPQAAELVKLRYFAGLDQQAAAATMGIGRRAADRLWAVARVRLFQTIRSA